MRLWVVPLLLLLGTVVTFQLSWNDPRQVLILCAMGGLVFVPAWLGRYRMRRLLLSGDVSRVLRSWQGSLPKMVHPETMAPLLAATTYAAYGWVEAARKALVYAVKGPAWDAALEQRLFVEALLDTFEGDRNAALQKAIRLEGLPLPTSGFWTRRRIAALRKGLTALTRAFAHESAKGDLRTLERAASLSPLVHWAMRYAAAIVAVDDGIPEKVAPLIAGAPTWPEESAFRMYHEELLAASAQRSS